MDPIQIATKITTPLALLAFIAALAFYAYRTRVAERRRVLETAPPRDRAALVEKVVRDFTILNTESLTSEQKYQLISDELKNRTRRFSIAATVAVVIALALAATIVVLAIISRTSKAQPELTSSQAQLPVDRRSTESTSPALPASTERIDLEIASRLNAAQQSVDRLGRTNWMDGDSNSNDGTSLRFAGQSMGGVVYGLDHSSDGMPEYKEDGFVSLLLNIKRDVDTSERSHIETVLANYYQLKNYCDQMPTSEERDRRLTRQQVAKALQWIKAKLDEMTLSRWRTGVPGSNLQQKQESSPSVTINTLK
jgi:hypothetical protein